MSEADLNQSMDGLNSSTVSVCSSATATPRRSARVAAAATPATSTRKTRQHQPTSARASSRTPSASSRRAPSSSRRLTRRSTATATATGVAASPPASTDPRAAAKHIIATLPGATAPGTNADAWSKQDDLTKSLQDALQCAGEAQHSTLLSALQPHVGSIFAALGFAVGCGRSGTQSRALECYASCFKAGSICSNASSSSSSSSSFHQSVERHLDQALVALMPIVAHNSAAFLANKVVSTLQVAMQHVSASKVLHALVREVNGGKHEMNKSKMTTMAGLASDAMEVLTTGHLPTSSSSSSDEGSIDIEQLQALPQSIYKDLIRAIVRLRKSSQTSLHPAGNQLLRGLIIRGTPNSTLTSERRELAKIERDTTNAFDAFAKALLGKELPAVTTCTASASSCDLFSPSRLRSASLAGTPLPAGSDTRPGTARKPIIVSAKSKGAHKGTPSSSKRGVVRYYADTMPKNILSPGPSMGQAKVDTHATRPLPSAAAVADEQQPEYNTAGAGLLDVEDVDISIVGGMNATCSTTKEKEDASWSYCYGAHQDGRDTIMGKQLDFNETDANGEGEEDSSKEVHMSLTTTHFNAAASARFEAALTNAEIAALDASINAGEGAAGASTAASADADVNVSTASELHIADANQDAADGGCAVVFKYDRSSMAMPMNQSMLSNARPSTAAAMNPISANSRGSILSPLKVIPLSSNVTTRSSMMDEHVTSTSAPVDATKSTTSTKKRLSGQKRKHAEEEVVTKQEDDAQVNDENAPHLALASSPSAPASPSSSSHSSSSTSSMLGEVRKINQQLKKKQKTDPSSASGSHSHKLITQALSILNDVSSAQMHASNQVWNESKKFFASKHATLRETRERARRRREETMKIIEANSKEIARYPTMQQHAQGQQPMEQIILQHIPPSSTDNDVSLMNM